jgi:2-oxoglutarate ferredoxin oxidoreductase subunit gamma
MLERVLIAGSGGQGIILAGKLLAAASVEDVPHVTFFPAYGAEVRGGTSNCQVIFSSREIASPVSEALDSMLLMNQASVNRFLPRIVPGGLLIVNTSLSALPDIPDTVSVAATELADDLGDPRVANTIMLGAYLARKGTPRTASVEQTIKETLAGKKQDLIELNIKALQLGLGVES